ncbi:MAG: hypothetical protein QW279_15695 [Candidatus Jordarchaeaceae archaeon]
MNEQLNYTVTPRYIFPQIMQNTDLSKKLLEVSTRSLPPIKAKSFQPFETVLEYLEQKPQSDFSLDLELKAISPTLTPLNAIDETPIIGIDVSCIRIGETETGIICAIRGAIVWNVNHHYSYLRIGPFPFHITEENKCEVLNHSNGKAFSKIGLHFSSLSEVLGRLCSQIERWIQTTVSYSTKNSIILWDGSLATSVQSNFNEVFRIIKIARNQGNVILGITKITTIRFLDWKITDIISSHEAPCLFEIEDLPLQDTRNMHFLGRIYIAKLAKSGSTFRLDIDRAITKEEGIRAVQKLIGNDLIYQGYPECLRLAHIYSTFTANDVLGIQSFLTHEYGLKILPRNNMRKVLFGPYGTGFED